MLIDDKIVM